MIIKKKADAQLFTNQFEMYSETDGKNNKRYFIFNDKERAGIITLMKYLDGSFTYHGKGENYCDEREIMIKDIKQFIWFNRKEINKKLKVKNTHENTHNSPIKI